MMNNGVLRVLAAGVALAAMIAPWSIGSALAATTAASAADPAAACFDRATNTINSGQVEAFDVTPGLDGIYFRRDADFQEFFSIDAETQAWFHLLKQALATRGIDLVFIPLPTRGIVQSALLDPDDPDQAIYDPDFARGEFAAYVSALKSAGINTVDVMAGLEASGGWDKFFYLHDHHWTTTGSSETAKWAGDLVKTLPIYEKLSKYAFDVSAIGPTDYKSVMAMDIQQRCGISLPAEPETRYQVTRAAISEDDLFGNSEQTNPVALVGTSFSAHSFLYFQAFLEQQTSLQVANYAVVGGEFDASLASLLFSRNFLEAPPPMIVWEAPSYYDTNFEVRADFPQLIPAVFGQCSGGDLVASSLATGAEATLTIEADKHVAGSSYYVAIDTTLSDNGKVTLDLHYANGDHFVQRLGDFGSVSNDGRYYFLLSDEPAGVLTSLTARTTSSPQHFSASVCKVPAEFSKEGT